MAGMNVLSDMLKVGSKLQKASAPKGKDVTDSPKRAAASFSELLSGSMKQKKVDPKGQNSEAGQDSEETQSAEDSEHSSQISNGLGNMQGYSNFTSLTQILQSDLPVGKEANSGNDVSQGKVTILKLLSLLSAEVSAQSGMTAQKPQGDGNNPITELDKYKQVISGLLEKLSGKITDLPPKGTTLSSRTKELSQEMAKIVQGWMTAEDKAPTKASTEVKETIIDVQKQNPSAGLGLAGNLLATNVADGKTVAIPVLGQISTAFREQVTDRHQELEELSLIQQVLQSDLPAGIEANAGDDVSQGKVTILKLLSLLSAEGSGQSGMTAQKPQGDNSITELDKYKQVSSDLLEKLSEKITEPPSKGAILSAGTKELSQEMAKIIQGWMTAEDKAPTKAPTEVKETIIDVQKQNPSAGLGLAGNLLATNVADGKTVAIPVLEQISTVFRGQVTNKHQELKELSIQLHPAELGTIQIAIRWENGQVHLQVQASEAATGQLLQKQILELRQTLTDQGVNCGMLQMGQGGEQQQSSQGDRSQRMFIQNVHPDEDENSILVTNSLSLEQDEINQINVTA